MLRGRTKPVTKVVMRPKRSSGTILILGLEAAGKTMLTYNLLRAAKAARDATTAVAEDEAVAIETSPTIGFNKEELALEHADVSLIDVGGNKPVRKLWHFYTSDSRNSALFWVVDCTSDDAKLQESAHALSEVCGTIDERLPIVVVAAKRDLYGARDPLAITRALTTGASPRDFAKRSVFTCSTSLDDCSSALELVNMVVPISSEREEVMLIDAPSEVERGHYQASVALGTILSRRGLDGDAIMERASPAVSLVGTSEHRSIPAEVIAEIFSFVSWPDLVPDSAHFYGAPLGPWATSRTFMAAAFDEATRRLLALSRPKLRVFLAERMRALVYLTVPEDLLGFHMLLVSCALFEVSFRESASPQSASATSGLDNWSTSHRELGSSQSVKPVPLNQLLRTNVACGGLSTSACDRSPYAACFSLCAFFTLLNKREVSLDAVVASEELWAKLVVRKERLGSISDMMDEISKLIFRAYYEAVAAIVINDDQFTDVLTLEYQQEAAAIGAPQCNVRKLRFAPHPLPSLQWEGSAIPVDSHHHHHHEEPQLYDGLIHVLRVAQPTIGLSSLPVSKALRDIICSGNFTELQYSEELHEGEDVFAAVVAFLQGKHCLRPERYRCGTVAITVRSRQLVRALLHTLPRVSPRITSLTVTWLEDQRLQAPRSGNAAAGAKATTRGQARGRWSDEDDDDDDVGSRSKGSKRDRRTAGKPRNAVALSEMEDLDVTPPAGETIGNVLEGFSEEYLISLDARFSFVRHNSDERGSTLTLESTPPAANGYRDANADAELLHDSDAAAAQAAYVRAPDMEIE